MDQFQIVVNELQLFLKKLGYKKNRLTWYKDKEHLTVIFSVQKSQYAKSEWYYYFGICLHAISGRNRHVLGSCQIQYRVDGGSINTTLSTKNLANLLERWESMHGDIPSLRRLAIQEKLPLLSTLEAKCYLTSRTD